MLVAGTLPPGTPVVIAIPLIVGLPLAAYLIALWFRHRKNKS